MLRKKLPHTAIHLSRILFLILVNVLQPNNKSKTLGKLLCKGINKYPLLPNSTFFHATQEEKICCSGFLMIFRQIKGDLIL